MLLVHGVVFGAIDERERTIDGISMDSVMLTSHVREIRNYEDRKCNAMEAQSSNVVHEESRNSSKGETMVSRSECRASEDRR